MPDYLVRVDAVNLYANAQGDRQQLSTLRGGGLMLLNAIRDMALEEHQVWTGHTFVRAISKGASTLLCQVSSENAKGLRESIEGFLSSNASGLPVNQTTFTVSLVESQNKKFREACEAGLAANRWRQMHSASVVFPRTGSERVCDVDLVRPTARAWNRPVKRRLAPVESDPLWNCPPRLVQTMNSEAKPDSVRLSFGKGLIGWIGQFMPESSKAAFAATALGGSRRRRRRLIFRTRKQAGAPALLHAVTVSADV